MIRKFFSFPEIEQFRSVIHSVHYRSRCVGKDENGDAIFDEELPLPTLKFRGSVKLHGTNAGIIFQYDESIAQYTPHAQSRSNIITPISDNAGFATFVHTSDVYRLLKLLPTVTADSYAEMPDIQIYGEWCGGNIQKGVALNGLDKMFVIFAIKIGRWLSDAEIKEVKIPEARIYNILDYPTYEVEIDFNNPQVAAEYMGTLVEAVEKQCPVGKAFGKEGIGEGIVWMCISEGWSGSRFWFKTKGDAHSLKTTNKEKVPIDTAKIESLQEFVNEYVSENRLNQGLDKLKENNMDLEMKSIAFFLKWVYNDIVKEELDTIVKNGLEPKDLGSPISNKARTWFIKKIDEAVGLK